MHYVEHLQQSVMDPVEIDAQTTEPELSTGLTNSETLHNMPEPSIASDKPKHIEAAQSKDKAKKHKNRHKKKKKSN
ncbi:unnamed protein product [Heterobilharzia americana]|nr:unnamed protein product [Heterobilharzia americana]